MRNLNQNQLKMFMTPSEIKGYAHPNVGDVETHTYSPGFDADPEGTMWEAKSNEAYDVGLTHSVRREGVREPVEIQHQYRLHSGSPDDAVISNGHHRIQAAEDASRMKKHELYVPVEHSY